MNSRTGGTDLGPQLSARLGYLLKRALLALEELHAEHLGPLGVNARELTVLLLLDGREPESQQQAAARLGVDRTTMVGLLDGLEHKGLVARQTDPLDRRRNVVGLTTNGQRTLRKARVASDKAEHELLGALSEREVRSFRELLGRVAAGGDRP